MGRGAGDGAGARRGNHCGRPRRILAPPYTETLPVTRSPRARRTPPQTLEFERRARRGAGDSYEIFNGDDCWYEWSGAFERRPGGWIISLERPVRTPPVEFAEISSFVRGEGAEALLLADMEARARRGEGGGAASARDGGREARARGGRGGVRLDRIQAGRFDGSRAAPRRAGRAARGVRLRRRRDRRQAARRSSSSRARARATTSSRARSRGRRRRPPRAASPRACARGEPSTR